MLLGALKEKCISRRTLEVWQNLGDCKAFGIQKYKNNKIFKSLTAGITANDVQIPLDMGGTQSKALKQK